MDRKNSIEIIVNGDEVFVPEGSTVVGLIGLLQLSEKQLAVELNRSILPRTLWSETGLKSGDKLEIVHFVGGG